MRVLHVVKTATGATWALRQMRVLRNLGIEVHVAIPEGPLVAQYRAAGVIVHLGQFSWPMRHPEIWPRRRTEFRRIVERVNPDIIHSHFVGTTLTMRFALGRNHPIPRIFQVPGPLHLEHTVFREAEIRSAGSRDVWIGSCQWTCDRYQRSGIASHRIFRSYYGSDLSEFEHRRQGTLRAELSLDPAQPLVGMVAYMYPPKRYLGQRRGLKGHEDLIDALAICRNKGWNIESVFIGGAWGGATAYESRIRAYGKEKLGESAHFLGTRHDVGRLYPDLDIAIHPSHSENLGGAAESLLHGVPTIGTTVGGFPDIIVPGETGWLVPPASPEHLAEAIVDVLRNPTLARDIALNGQARTRKILDVRETAREIADIYQQVTR